MKSHVNLLGVVLDDMGTRCCTSTTRDLKTITRRVDGEGLSFLTISLPDFASDLQKGLALGQVDSSLFVGYAKRGCLPKFLSGFTSRIFDTLTGRLLDEPDIDCIYAVRQICLLFSKINLPCSDARTAKAVAKFVECEKDVRKADKELVHEELLSFTKTAQLVFGNGVLSYMDKSIFEGTLVPKHGPGSTAERILGNKKYIQTSWPARLETYFPFGEYLFPNWRHFDPDSVDILDPGAELPVRVVTVPKTLKTPRIIAIEPVAMQYVQQAILECFLSSLHLDASHFANCFLGFDDQIPNQEMARLGSMNGSLATLDLSEASDRVSNQLVLRLFAGYPHASAGVQACRSRKADVPGYGVLRLAKFASMGSALCFPIEAMVFLTIVLMGIQEVLRRPLSERDLLDLVGKVRVYGDDIIVPVEYVQSVVAKLEAFGLKVNANKSFWTGKFRESCGKDYYDGIDVSVVKFRQSFPTQRQHVKEIISAVSFRNQQYFAGNWKTAAYMDRIIGKLIPFPMVLPESPGLGRHSYLGFDSQRECKYLQKPLVKAYVVTSRPPPDYLEGPAALLKWFLKRSAEPFADEDHLERAGRPEAVNIKLRWVSPT